MKKILFIILFPLLTLGAVVAQTIPDSLVVDTLVSPVDTLSFTIDTLEFTGDTLYFADTNGLDSLGRPLDSLQNRPSSKLSQVELSSDGLDAKVDYSAQDSMIYDIKNQKVYLYGQAKVAYEDLTIDAAYIEFD